MKLSSFLTTLLVLLSLGGCTLCRPTWTMIDPILGQVYLRYIHDDAPPLREYYVLREGGWLLNSVKYDTDGDWLYDAAVYYVNSPEGGVLRVMTIPPEGRMRAYSRASVDLLLPENERVTLEEPRESHPANRDRFACPEYEAAAEAVRQLAERLRRKGQGTR